MTLGGRTAALRPGGGAVPARLKSPLLPWLVLLLALALFVAGQWILASVNGFWEDEYFSLYSSDPAMPFAQLFRERIGPDSNPPLYFSLLHAVRLFVPDNRAAMTLLNLLFIAGAAGITYPSARRTGFTLAWAGCFGLMLVSGPVLRYAAEGRTYLLGMCLSFAASWFTALLIVGGRRPVSLLTLACINAVAAGTHLFAALFCCCLAAGLLALALAERRRDLVAPALALALPGGVLTLVWLTFALQHADNLTWITFDKAALANAVWEIRSLVFGPWPVAAPAALLLAAGLVSRATRALTGAFCVAFLVFVLLPMLASLWRPIVVPRYWLIGAPALCVLLVMVVATWLGLAREGRISRRLCWSGGILLALFALGSSAGGLRSAYTFIKSKPIWSGAEAVRRLAVNCPPGSIAVLGDPERYAIASGMPAELFRQRPASGPAPVNGSCGVVGWAEHVRLVAYPELADYTNETAPKDLLLARIGLAIDPASVDIDWHSSGFVVVRRKQ